jgi:hypothetical protein
MPKRTRTAFSQDINQFAASIVQQVEQATGSTKPTSKARVIDLNNKATVSEIMREMGRRGGIKGAAALNGKLTPEQRKRSARKAAKARWAKTGK